MTKIYSCIKLLWNEEKQAYEEVYSEFEEYKGDIALCKGGGGGGGDQRTEIRYAPYIESRHTTFLALIAAYRNTTIDDSPFTEYTDIEVDDAFFGSGYTIASFPSLYDMYGKFMAGLDIDALYSQIYEDTVNSAVINDLVSAEAAMMDDDIEANSVPRLQVGMRDINAVISSSFVVGKSVIEDARTKSLAKFSADLKYRMIPIASGKWTTHLEWNKGVVGVYAEIMKFYYSAKVDVNEVNYSMDVKDKLWPFTVLDFERAALGALQGATNTKTDVAGASTVAKAISGALSGAAMGAMIDSAWNTPAVAATSTTPAIAGSSAGSMWGGGIGAALGIAAALTY